MKEKIKKKLKMYIGFWLCVRDQRKVETTHTHTLIHSKKKLSIQIKIRDTKKKKM